MHKYRRHSKGIGFVEHAGRRHYFPGPYGSKESLAAYEAFLASLAAKQAGSLPHACEAYRDAHTASRGQSAAIASAHKQLVGHLGQCKLSEVTPQRLREFQRELARRGLSRKTIRNYTVILVQTVRWAASEGYCSSEVWSSLQVAGTPQVGAASKKRRPVSWQDVEDTLRWCPSPLAEMVFIQWMTGARSGTLVAARPDQFHGDEWRPEKHKTDWRGQELVIPIGPVTRLVLTPLLRLPAKRRIFPYASSDAYRRALTRIQRKHHLRRWTPHQLRHALGHSVRAEFGLEAAQAMLGHASVQAAQLYSERRLELAKQVVRLRG